MNEFLIAAAIFALLDDDVLEMFMDQTGLGYDKLNPMFNELKAQHPAAYDLARETGAAIADAGGYAELSLRTDLLSPEEWLRPLYFDDKLLVETGEYLISQGFSRERAWSEAQACVRIFRELGLDKMTLFADDNGKRVELTLRS